MKIDDMPYPRKKLTPIQAIKFYCKRICCVDDTISWKNCSASKCALYPYRIGKRPKKLPFEHYQKKTTDKLESTSKIIDTAINQGNSSDLQLDLNYIIEQAKKDEEKNGI